MHPRANHVPEAPCVVAIHQPNFFPWLGYFRKILEADRFLLLDRAEYSHGSWTNRVRMDLGGEPRWVTCPRKHPGAPAPITAIEIQDGQPWRKKLVKTLQSHYARSEHFAAVFPWIRELVTEGPGWLAAFNIGVIREICRRLEIDTELVLQSELDFPEGEDLRASELLAALVGHLGGHVYLAGDGADGYEAHAAYEARGIEHRRLGFRHPEYPRSGRPFVAGLSILDPLLHLGFEGTRDLLKGM